MKTLLKEEFTEIVKDSRSLGDDQKPKCKAHIMSLYDDIISNRPEVNVWAKELGCGVEIFPTHSVITIVPIPESP